MHFWATNMHKVPLISISISFNSVTALANFLAAILAPLRQDTTSRTPRFLQSNMGSMGDTTSLFLHQKQQIHKQCLLDLTLPNITSLGPLPKSHLLPIQVKLLQAAIWPCHKFAGIPNISQPIYGGTIKDGFKNLTSNISQPLVLICG